MPVPKKRLGSSDQNHRRSCWKAFTPTLMICPHCNDRKLTHRMCQTCGYYNGQSIMDVSQKFKAYRG